MIPPRIIWPTLTVSVQAGIGKKDPLSSHIGINPSIMMA